MKISPVNDALHCKNTPTYRYSTTISTESHPTNVQVSAVGKYCYVVPSDDEVDFGDQTIVAAGASSGGDRGDCPRKEFTLKNQSVVPAAFTVSAEATTHPTRKV